MTSKHLKPILFLLISCLLSALAQEVRYGMEPPPYYKSTPFRFQVQVTNEKPDQPPQLAKSQDFIVQAMPPSTSSSSQVTIINGDVKRVTNTSTVYTFMLTPKRTGKLKTPLCTTIVKGQKRYVMPQNITVERPNTNQTITLSMTADRTVCAVGQPVRLDFNWTTRLPQLDFTFQSPISNYTLTIPALNQDNLDAEPETTTESHGRSRTRIVANSQTPLAASQYSAGNKLVLAFSITVIPRKPGLVTLEPATIIAQVVDPRASRRRSRWPSFFDEAPTTRCAAESKPLTLTVKEPPAQGRPVAYTGLAEPCTIQTTADKTDVYVGDPIVLSITLKGPKFPQSIILPKLQDIPEFQKNFRIFDNNAPGTQSPDGSITFQRTIRAASTEVTEIPPLQIAWFDASDGQYHTAESPSIPLTVKASKVAAPVALPVQPAVEDKIDVTANLQGPKPNFPPQDCLANQAPAHQQDLITPELLILVLCPLIALLIAVVRSWISYRRQHAPQSQRRRAASRAISQLQKASHHAQPASQALTALQTYLSAKTQQQAASITLQDMEAYLRAHHASADLLRQTQDLVNTCEAAIYANQPLNDPDATISQLIALVEQVEKL